MIDAALSPDCQPDNEDDDDLCLEELLSHWRNRKDSRAWQQPVALWRPQRFVLDMNFLPQLEQTLSHTDSDDEVKEVVALPAYATVCVIPQSLSPKP